MEVPFVGPDEAVRILDDAEKVMSLQLSAGLEWKEDICDVCTHVAKKFDYGKILLHNMNVVLGETWKNERIKLFRSYQCLGWS